MLTTVATQAVASSLARAMAEQRLAACAQTEAIDAGYRWQREVRQEGERRRLLKTAATRFAAPEAALRARHPDELPAIVAAPCAQAHPALSDWVTDRVADEVAPA